MQSRTTSLALIFALFFIVSCKSDCAPDKTQCKRMGLCTEVDGECRATTDAECQGSEGCKLRGACTKNDKGFCAPATPAECQASEECKEQKRCFLLPNGTCDTKYACDKNLEALGGPAKNPGAWCIDPNVKNKAVEKFKAIEACVKKCKSRHKDVYKKPYQTCLKACKKGKGL